MKIVILPEGINPVLSQDFNDQKRLVLAVFECHTQFQSLFHSLFDSVLSRTEQPFAPAKRTQHANATYRNIVGRNMLRAFGFPVAICCDMLGVVGSNLKIVKIEPTTPNMSQHIATRWPNARNMLRPTMLRYVALACCHRLAGALRTFAPIATAHL